MAAPRPCLRCSEPVDGSYCVGCKPVKEHAESSSARGYDHRWRRLSARARRLQPFCSDCGSPHDLTCDHLVWPARSLADVDVVCRADNSRRGPSRGPRAKPRRAVATWGETQLEGVSRPPGGWANELVTGGNNSPSPLVPPSPSPPERPSEPPTDPAEGSTALRDKGDPCA